MLLINLKKLAIYMSCIGLVACASFSQHASYQHVSLAEGQANFIAQRYALAYQQLMPYAVRGNRDAEYAIGYMYFYGKGVMRNEEIANSWLERAAKKGHSLAKITLAKR